MKAFGTRPWFQGLALSLISLPVVRKWTSMGATTALQRCPIQPEGDRARRLSADALADVVTRIATVAGLEGRWRGHSLRRGFATAARRAGAGLERIDRPGGWADGSTVRAARVALLRWLSALLDAQDAVVVSAQAVIRTEIVADETTVTAFVRRGCRKRSTTSKEMIMAMASQVSIPPVWPNSPHRRNAANVASTVRRTSRFWQYGG
ncbi:tyrosine-type recombinase/integrase [Streptosporangium sp. NPDC002544]|uniref:tyrosine-type recombinase/integrase n=1 Tax=Streptosporangium sp. NPDC002544 TaxID=3154538 RepID=UPI003320A38C